MIGGRYFLSSKLFTDFRDTPQPDGPLFYDKPKGLWYAVGCGWSDMILHEYSSKLNRYLYRIEVDTSDMFFIKNSKETDDFTEVYGHTVLPDEYHLGNKDDAIDWHFLAKGYTGIEIAPYVSSRRMKLKWYYSWDVASGCIWSKKAFKKVELVADLDKE